EEEATEAAPSPAVLEEEDDFDMDWLDEIGQEAAQEAAATTPEPATEETEEPAEPDWLAGLAADQTETDEEEDWLADLSGTSTEAETEAEPPQAVSAEEEPQEPEEESDALNTDWLHQIGQEAAQEAAATSIEPAAEETEGAVSDEETPPWLASIEQANVSDQALSSDDTIGRFISDLEADQPAEQEEEAPPPPAEEDEFDMDWLAEVSEDEPESEAETFLPEEEPAEPETFEPAEEAPTEEQVPSLDIEDTGVWLASLGVEELETEEQADEEEEAPEDIPTWLKEPQVEEEPTITPTKADEWVPEFNEAPENAPEPELEQEPAQAETTPEPAAEPVAEPDIQLDPKSPEGILENSRTLIQEGHLDAGIAGYNKLIKKGKMVGSVIEDIQAAIQRHPVESNLWQTLGDAYLRMDNLQEALDAYTKAEELLR
ncbi:tetratricopeptide repeat protein, partial [bacterium]|nr:tetratricopeptide repeat protein [bacterium]